MLAVSLSNFFHKECKEWNERLDFFINEVDSFSKRIAEVVNANTAIEVLSQAEHFQNKFIIEKENIDILKHEVKVHMEAISSEMQREKILDEIDHSGNQIDLREKMRIEDKLFIDMKHELYSFLGKVL